MLSSLGSQSVLPNLWPTEGLEWQTLQQGPTEQILYGELHQDKISSLVVYTKALDIPNSDLGPKDAYCQQACVDSNLRLRMCLFKLRMPADGSLEAVLQYSKPQVTRSPKIGFFAAYQTANEGLEYRYSEISCELSIGSHRMSLGHAEVGSCLVEFGFYCDRQPDIFHQELLIIKRLVISPAHVLGDYDFDISNIRAAQRGKESCNERRLAWQWRGSYQTWPIWLPRSETTGPFSHFTILIERREVGKAYCLEFPVLPDDLQSLGVSKEKVEVQIVGSLFGGEKIVSEIVTLQKSDLVSEQK